MLTHLKDSELNYDIPTFIDVKKRFKNITFGKGDRPLCGIKDSGPGYAYDLPSFVDKFKIKLLKKKK